MLTATYVLAALFVTGVAGTPHSPAETLIYDVVLFNAVPLAAAAVCLQAARRVPAERVPWLALCVAWLLSVAGNLCFSFSSPSSFPSAADLFYLAAYPMIAVVALGLLHLRGARLQPSAWLDGAVTALGVTACAVTFLIDPSLDLSGLEASAATLTYPVADVLLLALVTAVIAVVGLQGDRGLLLLAGAMVCKLGGDVLLTRAEAQDGYVVGGPVDLAWVAATLLGATGAHLARGRRDVDRAESTRSPTGWRALALPLTCTVASLVVLGLEWGDGAASVGEVAALGCLGMSLARTTVTFLEIRSLQEVRRQAATDDLTGLPNRRALLERLDRTLAAGQPVALLLLDLDGFKAVNDGLGHQAGDQLLRELGGRIRPALRPSDLLARLGGDEFAVLLPGADGTAAEECAERIHRLVCRPVPLAGSSVQVGASIGIAEAPRDAADVTDLLRCADAAMYEAKARRGGIRSFARHDAVPALPDDSPADSAGPGGLRFRPLVDGSGRVVAAEAWLHPADGAPPAPASLAALPAVLRAAAAWWSSTAVRVRVVVTGAELTGSRPIDRISAALLRHALPAECLLLRLDPDAFFSTPERAVALLTALRSTGVRTAVDVGGPGVLALAHLADLPADDIHLAPALVEEVVGESRAALVVGHTVTLARAFGSAVVAEDPGDEAGAVLARLGCSVRRRGAPLSPAEFDLWLDRTAA
jgi:diguanylate cyclase (GGDEF)-like protein